MPPLCKCKWKPRKNPWSRGLASEYHLAASAHFTGPGRVHWLDVAKELSAHGPNGWLNCHLGDKASSVLLPVLIAVRPPKFTITYPEWPECRSISPGCSVLSLWPLHAPPVALYIKPSVNLTWKELKVWYTTPWRGRLPAIVLSQIRSHARIQHEGQDLPVLVALKHVSHRPNTLFCIGNVHGLRIIVTFVFSKLIWLESYNFCYVFQSLALSQFSWCLSCCYILLLLCLCYAALAFPPWDRCGRFRE